MRRRIGGWNDRARSPLPLGKVLARGLARRGLLVAVTALRAALGPR